MNSKLLELMFQPKMWEHMIAKMNDEKGLNKTLLRQLCNPEVRLQIYYAIKNNKYKIMNTHAALIPKDEPNSFRRVHICEDIDRCLLSIINDCYFQLFPQLIDEHVWSYQKGKSSQEATQMIVGEIQKVIKNINRPDKFIGYKIDFHHFFDDVCLEEIDRVFDTCENLLGFERGSEPVTRMLKEFYHDDLIFDENGNLVHEYTGLRQGAAISSFLADAILNDIDREMAKRVLYIRYSDDCLLLGENAEEAYEVMLEMLKKYNVTINPKKVSPLYSDKYFTFLGFLIKKDVITLSKNRVKKLTKAVYDRTLAKPNISPNQAKQNIKQLLYNDGDGYSWSSACFGAMQNNEKDIDVLNAYIMDCIRLCEVRYSYNKERKSKGLKPRQIKYNMSHVGGIGVVTDRDNYTLIRGCGSKIKTARQRTQKEIEHYKSVGCLLKCYKLGRPIYESVVRSI